MADPWAAGPGLAGGGINGGITANEERPPGMGGMLSGGGGGDPKREMAQIMNWENAGASFEREFKEFCARPENRPLLEKHQRTEWKKGQRLSRKMKVAEFQDKVLTADYQAQKNIAPFLENRVLRRVVQTFCNDPNNDFGKWARNPEVLRLLASAQELMDSGKVTEEEMERNMVAFLKSDANPGRAEFELKTRQKVRVPTEQLISALNEHLEERRKGNELYKEKRFHEAVRQYERALSIVELVVGLSSADQKEVDVNRIAAHLNLAAAHMALRNFGKAIESCDAALALKAHDVKGLLRRAKAYIGRHEYARARADLEQVKELEPGNAAAEAVLAGLKKKAKAERGAERALFKGCLDQY